MLNTLTTHQIFHLLALIILLNYSESVEHKTEASTSNIDFRIVRANEQVRLSHKNCRNDSQWSVSATAQVVQPFFAATPSNAHRYVCFNEHKSGLLRVIYMEDEFSMSLHNTFSIEHGEPLRVSCSVSFWMMFHFGVISLKIYHGDQVLLETSRRTQIGKKTELNIDGFVESNFYRGKDFTCVWHIQDFAEFQPIEHTITLSQSIHITMAARNVRPSKLKAKVGEVIRCLYDGFPAAHTIQWSRESLTDIYDTLRNKRSVDIQMLEENNYVWMGGTSKDPAEMRMYQSGTTLMKCSVNNTHESYRGDEAHWKGNITIDPLDVYKTQADYDEMKFVKKGDGVTLRIPQCSDQAIWVDGKEQISEKIRVDSSGAFSKRYIAFHNGAPCGAVSLVVIEKGLYMTYPRKTFLTLDDDLSISCSVSGWFDALLKKDLALFINGTKEVKKVMVKSNTKNGITTLTLHGDLKNSFLGPARVLCRWTYEDISHAQYFQEQAIQLDIWMPLKWVHPNVTTAREGTTIQCLHLSYPQASCSWQDSDNLTLKLSDGVGNFQKTCTCSNSYKSQKSTKTWKGTITVVSKDSYIKTFVNQRELKYLIIDKACTTPVGLVVLMSGFLNFIML